MIDRLASMFRIEDLRKKILFTLLVVVIYRVGSFIILPYVDYAAVQKSLTQENSGLLSYFALLAGGGLRNLALFALGIMPYITASIIMQLLGEIVPKLKAWKDEGQDGQKKTTQLTRYVTIFLALLQAAVLVSQLNQGRLFNQNFDQGSSAITTFLLPNMNTWKFLMIIITLVAGTAMIMWLGELITQRGIGNGMSIIIFASVASSVPFQFQAVWTQGGTFKFFVITIIGIGMIAGVVFIESGQRRIPVQFAKRVVGRKMMGGQSSYIPIKVNTAGVVPVIFAQSLLVFPALLAGLIGNQGISKFIERNFINGQSWWYMLAEVGLIMAFAYFYTYITFNPAQQADIIRKQGGYIPGIKPGLETEKYFARILNRITLPGAMTIAFIAGLPIAVTILWKIQQFPFGGVSMLILVSVALETMKQIDSQMSLRNYEGFLSK
ncbi:MAG: preprotein translocase subunit SecY [Acidimicrobiia bacterium]|nr:preprotein translocase subunit SecY [Acidimicrobiia bacterium]